MATAMRAVGAALYEGPVAWGNENRIASGSVKIVLGPAPAPKRDEESAEERAAREKREGWQVLLHSSGADPSPFIEAEARIARGDS